MASGPRTQRHQQLKTQFAREKSPQIRFFRSLLVGNRSGVAGQATLGGKTPRRRRIKDRDTLVLAHQRYRVGGRARLSDGD